MQGNFKTCLEALEHLIRGSSTGSSAEEAEKNRAIVRAAFEAWAAGGTFADILDEEVEWTIAGSGRSGGTFRGRQKFLDGAYRPIADRFASGMKPTVLGLFADGDEVIVRWDGIAPMKDGQTYRNSYAWFFRMHNGRVVRATAFLDLPTYDAARDGRPLPSWPDPPSAARAKSEPTK
jgi:Ketosteroid isomerase-related protein